MSESEHETGSIRDEDLPEDLQPGEENPLAEPLDEEDRDDLDVQGGKTPEESDEEESDDEDDDEDEDGASDDDD